VPERPATETPRLHLLELNPVSLALWEWPGEESVAHPALLFAHATGFHGRVWDTIIRMLPGRRVLALELRGHGRSGKPAPPYHWRAFGNDVVALVRKLELRNVVGIGHSSGGHAMTMAAALAPEAFRELLLIDPTIFPPERYQQTRVDASFTLRRKNHFQSPDEMMERFRNRPPFANWNSDTLRTYCEFGLLPQDGGYVLACPPPVEASIYAESNAPDSDIYPEIAGIAQPVTIMRAGMERPPGVFDLSTSPTAADLASKFRNGRDVLLPKQSHYIPMEVPETVVAEVEKIA
jgi:lipase